MAAVQRSSTNVTHVNKSNWFQQPSFEDGFSHCDCFDSRQTQGKQRCQYADFSPFSRIFHLSRNCQISNHCEMYLPSMVTVNYTYYDFWSDVEKEKWLQHYYGGKQEIHQWHRCPESPLDILINFVNCFEFFWNSKERLIHVLKLIRAWNIKQYLKTTSNECEHIPTNIEAHVPKTRQPSILQIRK